MNIILCEESFSRFTVIPGPRGGEARMTTMLSIIMFGLHFNSRAMYIIRIYSYKSPC